MTDQPAPVIVVNVDESMSLAEVSRISREAGVSMESVVTAFVRERGE